MENKSDDILNTLTLANGKEEVKKATTPKKKAVKKAAKKPKYSYEELKKKKPYELEAICKELSILVGRFNKVEVIKNILDKN
jgi:Fic family protein